MPRAASLESTPPPCSLDGPRFGVFDPAVAFVAQRGAPRTRLWLPTRVYADTGQVVGVSHDVSETGVLLLLSAPVSSGVQVRLAFEVPGDSARTLEASGRVVHYAPNLVDPGGLWRHRVGVLLDEPMGEFRRLIEELAGASTFYRPPRQH